MVSLRFNLVALVAVLSSTSNVYSFSIINQKNHGTRTTISSISSPVRKQQTTILHMAEENTNTEPVFVPTVLKKEIVYDDKSGRFYETGFGDGDCIPDEEFCMTDKESGEMIRLTVEEKERIFLDSLQVRKISIHIIYFKIHFFFVLYRPFMVIVRITNEALKIRLYKPNHLLFLYTVILYKWT